MTDLHYAAYCNDAEEVRKELRNGAFVDVQDDSGWTPLHWSIDMAQTGGEPERVVALLLGAGASANAADHAGFSALMRACGRNNHVIVEQLIQAGANVHGRSSSGTTALHEAAGANFIAGIFRLLIMGADPTVVDDFHRTPEDLAKQCGFEECVAVLKVARH